MGENDADSEDNEISYQENESAKKKRQRDAAKLVIMSAWHNENWPSFEETLDYLPVDDFDGCFLRAVNFVRKQKFDKSNEFIRKARSRLQRKIEKNYQQPYSRIYPDILNAQLLSELEEVMHLKSCRGTSREPARRMQMQRMWETRLIGSNSGCKGMLKMEGVRPSIEDWQRILLVRSLDRVIILDLFILDSFILD